jgi:hypothetical protein
MRFGVAVDEEANLVSRWLQIERVWPRVAARGETRVYSTTL